MKNKANNATNNLPTTAAGTKFTTFPDLIVIAPTAKPIAVIKPKNSEKISYTYRVKKKDNS